MRGLVDPVGHPREGPGGGLLRKLWQFCAAAGLTACLLAGFRVETAAQVIPETRGRPSPELPPIQPSPSPPSSLAVPVPPQPSGGAPLPPSGTCLRRLFTKSRDAAISGLRASRGDTLSAFATSA